LTPRQQLAFVIAGEHIIYSFARVFLSDGRAAVGMHPEVRRLLQWHAAEEIEHQSVASDVHRHVYGTGVECAIEMVAIFAQTAATISRALWHLWSSLLEADRLRRPAD